MLYSHSVRLAYLTPLALVLVTTLTGCGQESQKSQRTKKQAQVSTVFSLLTGVSSGDQSDSQLDFNLFCDGLETIKGTRSTDDAKPLISFTGAGLEDGVKCAIEVRGPVRDGLTWLGKEATPGLYYASTKSAIKSGQLSARLFKVYTEADSGSTPTTKTIAIDLQDAGTCQNFDRKVYECQDAVTAPSDMLKTYGFDVAEKDSVLIVNQVEPTSIFGKSGLLAGDHLVSVENVAIADLKTLMMALKQWNALSPKPSFKLSILRDQEAKDLTIAP